MLPEIKRPASERCKIAEKSMNISTMVRIIVNTGKGNVSSMLATLSFRIRNRLPVR